MKNIFSKKITYFYLLSAILLISSVFLYYKFQDYNNVSVDASTLTMPALCREGKFLGLGINTYNFTTSELYSMGTPWGFNWGLDKTVGQDGATSANNYFDSGNYIPTVWGYGPNENFDNMTHLKNDILTPTYNGYLLVFNEPDEKAQSDISPDRAVEFLYKLTKWKAENNRPFKIMFGGTEKGPDWILDFHSAWRAKCDNDVAYSWCKNKEPDIAGIHAHVYDVTWLKYKDGTPVTSQSTMDRWVAFNADKANLWATKGEFFITEMGELVNNEGSEEKNFAKTKAYMDYWFVNLATNPKYKFVDRVNWFALGRTEGSQWETATYKYTALKYINGNSVTNTPLYNYYTNYCKVSANATSGLCNIRPIGGLCDTPETIPNQNSSIYDVSVLSSSLSSQTLLYPVVDDNYTTFATISGNNATLNGKSMIVDTKNSHQINKVKLSFIDEDRPEVLRIDASNSSTFNTFETIAYDYNTFDKDASYGRVGVSGENGSNLYTKVYSFNPTTARYYRIVFEQIRRNDQLNHTIKFSGIQLYGKRIWPSTYSAVGTTFIPKSFLSPSNFSGKMSGDMKFTWDSGQMVSQVYLDVWINGVQQPSGGGYSRWICNSVSSCLDGGSVTFKIPQGTKNGTPMVLEIILNSGGTDPVSKQFKYFYEKKIFKYISNIGY